MKEWIANAYSEGSITRKTRGLECLPKQVMACQPLTFGHAGSLALIVLHGKKALSAHDSPATQMHAYTIFKWILLA